MIEIGLDIDAARARNSLNQFGDKAKRSGSKAGDSFSKGFGVGSAAISVALGNILTSAVSATARAIKNVVSEGVRAAQVQEDAIVKLNAILAKNGEFSRELSTDLQRFASDLQQVSAVGDEAVISQLAFAQSLGATVDQSKAIVTAAADLSAALGISFDAAVRNVTKTLGGLKGELGEAIPELGVLTAEQLKAGEAIDVVARKFAGAAAAQVPTFSGQINQLSKNYGDLTESVGFFITKSPVFVEIIGIANKAVLEINKNLSGSDGIKTATLALLDFGTAINQFVIAPLELTFNTARFVFSKINEFVAASVAIAGQGAGAIAGVLDTIGIGSGFAEKLKTFADSSNEVFQEVAQDSENAFNSIFDGSAFGATEQFIERVRLNVEAAKGAFEESPINIETGPAVSGLEKISETAKQVGAQVKAGLANVISQSVQTVIKNIAAGENAFSGFAKLLFNLFGDIAIQIGQTLIFAGLGIESLKTLSGAAAIAAGIGLVAVGSILKAFAGGGGGASQGIDGSSQAAISGETGTQQFQEEQREGRAIGVTVNIQGDVLDSEESGLRIAELLQQAVNDQGFRVA